MFKEQENLLKTNEPSPEAIKLNSNLKNTSTEVPDKLNSSSDEKKLTSEQLIDTLIKQGSVVAKTIKEKIEEEKKSAKASSDPESQSQNAPLAENNSQESQINKTINEEKTKMDENLTKAFSDLDTNLGKKLDALISLMTKAQEQAPAPAAQAPEVPAAPAPAEKPPEASSTEKTMEDRFLALEAQNKALMEKIEAISNQPVPTNIQTGVKEQAPAPAPAATTQTPAPKSDATREQEIEALQAKIQAMPNCQEKIDLGKKLTSMQMGF